MQVVIGIATCRRPRGLARLLHALTHSAVPDGVRVEVLVVDNDARGSAADVVRAARTRLPFPLRYVCETRAGVSFARNAVLAEAAEADALAFIDDDERPQPGWLAALLETQRSSGADAVCGPVRPVFERPVPAWLARAFERTVYLRPRKGRPLHEIATNNLLLQLAPVRREGLAFDPSLALIGGEDTLFGETLRGCGLRFAWAEDALVHEDVPAARARLGWLLRRWYRTGNTETLLRLRPRASARARAGIVGAGLLRVGTGAAAVIGLLPLVLLGHALVPILRLRTVCRGLGMIAAAFGRLHREYGGLHAPGRDPLAGGSPAGAAGA